MKTKNQKSHRQNKSSRKNQRPKAAVQYGTQRQQRFVAANPLVQQSEVGSGSLTPAGVLQLQQKVGNQAVLQLLKKTSRNSLQRTKNKTGLPQQLKAGIEHLSGYSMDDVRVHYNSPEPAKLGAEAYTKGEEIHLASGQSDHLPHEAWHVVQQKQGRVKATMQAKGIAISDDQPLEREADLMGSKARRLEPTDMAPKSLRQATASGPVQRSAKDVYRGGAELEYRQGKAELTFGNLPTTPQADEAEIKKLVRQGLKGIPIKEIGTLQKTQLTGNNWELTVETNKGTALDEHNKIRVVLELILGGPTGSTLEDLKTASDAAAQAVAALDKKDGQDHPAAISFEGAGNKIKDAVIGKRKKIGKAKAGIKGEQFQEEAYAGQHPLALDWSNLTVNGQWDPDGEKPSEKPWGLQVTLGVPLADQAKAGGALAAKGLTDTSKPTVGEEVSWSAKNILLKLDEKQNLVNQPIDFASAKQAFQDKYKVAYDEGSDDHQSKLINVVIPEMQEAKKNSIHAALDAAVKQDNQQNKAPSMATLDGLARVLAAYVRGKNNSAADGPKHNMKYVIKNPLQDVIANAASNMGDGGWYNRFRDACVDLILSTEGGLDKYNWTGQSLTLAEWGQRMKQGNVDLVAKYDAAYRSSQIGGLSSLNDISDLGGEFAAAPIIEFRDLGDKKPSEMRGVFEKIITEIEK